MDIEKIKQDAARNSVFAELKLRLNQLRTVIAYYLDKAEYKNHDKTILKVTDSSGYDELNEEIEAVLKECGELRTEHKKLCL